MVISACTYSFDVGPPGAKPNCDDLAAQMMKQLSTLKNCSPGVSGCGNKVVDECGCPRATSSEAVSAYLQARDSYVSQGCPKQCKACDEETQAACVMDPKGGLFFCVP